MKMYASMVPPNTLEFFRSGARAEKNLQAGGDMTTFQGKEVFETRDFAVNPVCLTQLPRAILNLKPLQVDFSASPIDQLSRERQVNPKP